MAPTPSQTIGPFFRHRLDGLTSCSLVPLGEPGAIRLTGRVLDATGDPVPDALVEIWQADGRGEFPDTDDSGFPGFGRCLVDDDGCYCFTTCKPGRVDDAQAPHVDVSVFARGLLQRVVTRLYFPDEVEANAADPVLDSIDAARRSTVVAVPDDEGLRFDIHLAGERETVFFRW